MHKQTLINNNSFLIIHLYYYNVLMVVNFPYTVIMLCLILIHVFSDLMMRDNLFELVTTSRTFYIQVGMSNSCNIYVLQYVIYALIFDGEINAYCNGVSVAGEEREENSFI